MTRFSLSLGQRQALRVVLEERPANVRVSRVPQRERPVLAVELAELPESVEAASARVHEIVAAVHEAIGDSAARLEFSICATEDVQAGTVGGISLYSRPPST